MLSEEMKKCLIEASLGFLIEDSDITDEQVIRYVKDLWNIDLCKDKEQS